MRTLLVTIFCLLFFSPLFAQNCTTPGQTPGTAFPVCGTSTFHQVNVPICSTHPLVVPGCSGGNNSAAYSDKNPFWYKFTCYESGSLGFLIKPIDQGDDYDWQLYDITGHNPDEVFTNNSLIVTGNWAGTYGNTGASSNGVNFIQCASDPNAHENSFSKMPNLVKGHTYILLVSHYTDSQIGYNLSFNGGTAVITDTTTPHLKYTAASCAGDVLQVSLSKKIKCSSIAGDGSDFYVTPAGNSVVSGTGFNCSLKFDTDSLELKLSQVLAPGNYTLHAKRGSDGNTLLDYCDNPVPETDVLDFTVLPKQPTPMDSLTQVTCAPQSLQLVFRNAILCSSIAPDGSDFIVTGSYPVAVSKVEGACSGTSTKAITITLDHPLQQEGNFTITLQKGSDGNTLLDECVEETPAGSSLSFSVKDTVSADFTYAIGYGCQVDTVNFNYTTQNGVDQWSWNLDDNFRSLQQTPQAFYSDFDTKNITLAVTNGFCSDSSSAAIALDNFLKADFAADGDICPQEPIVFTSSSVGKIVDHQWLFGDGATSNEASPSHTFAQPLQETVYNTKYTITDQWGCKSTISKPMHIYSSCTIAVPNAFTPNNDGKNDSFYPANAVKAQNLIFKVYNRWGQLVYQSANWRQGWDGTYKGQAQGPGVYVWLLQYTDGRNGQAVQRKGTVMLIR